MASGASTFSAALADFLAGTPDFFIQAFGDPSTNYAVTNYGAFVQDHFSLLPHLTLDLGVRYDFEQLPAGFNEDTTDFSPRIGMAFSPSPRWVLRAGYGIFFDRQILANLNRAVVENGVSGFEQVANGSEATSLFQGARGGRADFARRWHCAFDLSSGPPLGNAVQPADQW